jgi:sulfhydrogenase subunit beta (sulfur reductase)
MMYILEKKNLDQTLKNWFTKYKVIAPQIVDGISQFHPISPDSELVLNESINTRYPPKSLFLPQSEVMLRYNPQLNKMENVEVLPDQRIIFGIRPCDANAITLLDTVFDTEEYRDPYWTAHRSSSTIIGLGCNKPQSTCFCTTVGYGPFNHDGMDALMTEIDDNYFIEVFSEKGETLFSELPFASEEEQEKVKRHQTQVAESMTIAFETENLKHTLDNLFESNFWGEIAESCLGCGVCTFLCPTCFCFDIVDEVQRNKRVRNWDTCMFRIYSQEASGHNPRPTQAERTRQRLMHKYSYWLDHIGKIGCTGCGRCVRYCPVGLDIRAMIRAASDFESEVIHAR